MTTVLIVDDHSTVRFALRMLLERERFKVVGEVENGSEVAQVARNLRPDVVILDIGLPGLDGMEVMLKKSQEGRSAAGEDILLAISKYEQTNQISKSLLAEVTEQLHTAH